MNTFPVSPSRMALFSGFFLTGLSGFGGVLPHARYRLVERHRWLNEQEFADLLALCQTLPGPNIVNVSIVVGARFHGWQGSLIAICGLMLAPLAIVLALAALYRQAADHAQLQHVLGAVAAGAAGLVLATGARLWRTLPRHGWSFMLLLATFLAVFWLRLPLLLILVIAAPVGIACSRWAQRNEERRP